ncbi:hypothetical protein CY35_14G015100 [Sphagnum magellanicum]|nr:hypothetical protein CY35_14G015100 [Sphagnum magellanicum]
MSGLSNAFPAPALQPLRDLFTSVPSEHQPLPPATKDFRQNIHAYNSALVDNNVDKCRYNAPTAPEMAGLLLGDGDELVTGRDIRVHARDGGLWRISDLHPTYDPLHFVLFHPHGKADWQSGMPHAVVAPIRQWAVGGEEEGDAGHVAVDAEPAQPAHDDGSEEEEWGVDQYSKNEGPLRVAIYGGVADAVANNDANTDNLGKLIILPSSSISGHRHMVQLYQDSMAIVRQYGKPDLFITMTCNPKWKEIVSALKPDEIANDRPDLVTCVFVGKLQHLMDELLKKGIFGPDEYNRMVSVELPDKDAHPTLFEVVTSCMLHGPCGTINPHCPCMADGVMPYNPYLSLLFNCHINVEVCTSVAAIKYLYKYVYKGHDHAQVDVGLVDATTPDGAAPTQPRMRDEIKIYQDGRYVSASKASHRLYGFDLHKEHLNVVRLAVHLKGRQTILFQEGTDVAAALFATLLVFNVVANPLVLWECFKEDMVGAQLYPCMALHVNLPYGFAWSWFACYDIAKYDATTQAAMRDEHVPQLNPEQRAVYENVMVTVNRLAFFVDGLGGTGKTFLCSCLLSTVRAQGRVAVAVASSGIAALLLDGGRTTHSRFKIPVQGLNSTSTCYISKDFELAALLQATALIVWDEVIMMHRHVFEAVNRSLQDIMAVINPAFKFLPFGSLVVVFGGDFRQILPVVPRGTRGDVVTAALNHSSIWQHVRVFKLHTNMHAFADYLQHVGEGAECVYPSVGEDSILIPHDMCYNGPTVADLIEEVYGALSSIVEYATRSAYIIERAILTPLNEDVDALNKLINDKYAFTKHDGSPAQHRVYYSANSVVHGEQHGIYPTEFLNTLSFLGVPPHELHLQEGCPIILLRNMTSTLANGTRFIVIQLMQHVIEAEVATGPAKGQRVFIPRLSITPSDTERMPFTLRRRQFLMCPAFAMTINKAQGQTLKMVSIFLPKPVFTHGQLYVAMSRIGCLEGVKLLVTDGWEDAHENAPADVYTHNVVYTEVL